MANASMRHTPTWVRVTLVVIVLGGLLLAGTLRMRYNEMAERNAALADRVAQAEENNAQLREELAQPFDFEYVKRVARRELGYCLPGEIIYYSDFEK